MERWDQLYTGGYRFCFGDGVVIKKGKKVFHKAVLV